jgi:hypothetical protein
VDIEVPQRRPDRELHPVPVQVGGEVLGGAGGVGTHQHRPALLLVAGPQRGGQLGQRGVEHRDVIDHGVRPGLPRTQQLSQGFPGPTGPVIGEGQQRVEPERAPVD